MNQKLYIFVENFSTETREEFFEKELPFLTKEFKHVCVLSLYPKNNKRLNFSAGNLEVKDFDFFQPANRIKLFFGNFFRILSVLFTELRQTHNRRFYFKNFKSLFNQLLLTISASNKLENTIKNDINTETVFYTYWFKQWTFALTLLKQKHKNIKVVSRIHGADYDEEQVKTILPFRYFQLSKVNRIFPVSDFAKKYMMNEFKMDANKITTSRLGLNLYRQLSPVSKSELTIVSCSSVISLKRVHLILDIIENIKTNAKWVHFGHGDLFEELKEKVKLHSKHNIELKGYIPNGEFIQYLSLNPVSFFINVSESEGIPVSMMEAIAKGIPLIGTNICGVPEIVTNKTGFLIPCDFEPKKVASLIEEHHLNGSFYDKEFRKGIQDFYFQNFSADRNHYFLTTQLLTV